ncbi:Crp/Fnr family transcriptional regulator [Marinobacterium arenosum]|uniref:Crp/Fnr family transcriptional regulator n=1 Tax=Marinobacterium arenosum TaxID=2862496 RepID=UPI001C94DDC1|nr:Crp/Fnr family transcriptional regulator [Marinobacterium arenosum]MBY4675834.1 Crp/Fnr family transcriptional regulator [Marinobacterium arenosum]
MKTVDANTVIDTLGLPYLHDLSTFGALSDAAILSLLRHGEIKRLSKGEILYQWHSPVTGFGVVLEGDFAFYKHCEGHDVLTRHFLSGEQMGFDTMIALKPHSGTAVAAEETLVLEISSGQFYDLHIDFPADFGLLMINLSRELAREIAMLEEVIGQSTGWHLATHL